MKASSLKVFKIIACLAATLTFVTLSIRLNSDHFVKTISHIRLDKRKDLNDSIKLQHVINEMPYLPIEDLINKKNNHRNINLTCAWYPMLNVVQIHNNYWQKFQNTNITYYIFGAYLDNRPTVVGVEPVIRVLTTIHFIGKKDEEYPISYCQFWYEEQQAPIIVEANKIHRLWYHYWGHGLEHNYGHFISCPLPKEHIDWIPRTVSLVSSPCDKATNNVRVTYVPRKDDEIRRGFAVCVKGMDYLYVDKSYRLVEYFEVMRSLGAEKIILYNLQVHANMTKVLRYYEKTGFIEYRPFSSSSEVGNLPEYSHFNMDKNYYPYMLQEVIPYNDCLYRNMYKYRYVAVADIDEILMPLANYTNWHDLMEFAENIPDPNCKKFASYCFRCIYFPQYPEKPKYTDEFPEYFYMLQHVERVQKHIRPDWATKCFHSTDYVIATHNHFPFHVSDGVCGSYSFNASDAQMQHYREPPIKETLKDPVADKNLWRFKDEVIERSTRVFEDLKFFKEIAIED